MEQRENAVGKNILHHCLTRTSIFVLFLVVICKQPSGC